MPSPLAHTTAGYAVYRLLRRRRSDWEPQVWRLPLILLVTLVFSILPDFDAVAGILAGDIGRYHNQGTHSLVVGLLVALLFAVLLARGRMHAFKAWFPPLLLSYELHVLMDVVTLGERGVMLLWPLSSARFDVPFTLFYGVRWSEGIFAWQHLVTLATEALFALLVLGGLYLLERRQNVPSGPSQRRPLSEAEVD
ncbi:MAG: metal-dependent hydrolase [Chloroflexi bacterium]|nr:metal-dependent hydrolase [Chloroflexota bacterium]